MNKDLQNIFLRLKLLRCIDFSHYRPSMLERRVKARLDQLGIDDYEKYLELLNIDPAECDALIDVIAINVSSFFRDPIVCEIIAQTVIPELLERKNRPGAREFRVWSAGCATGEEIYSLAILLREALKKNPQPWTYHLFGTDIDGKALRQAEKTIYKRESLEETKLGILDSYFEPLAGNFMLKPVIREMVRFSQDDLTSEKTDSPAESVFGGFDIILCRNLLIYFNRELQKRVLHKFLRTLTPGGYLVLGSSESLPEELAPCFRSVDSRNQIYQKRLGI